MTPILLVDDREANLLVLEAILERMPVRTLRATSGAEALGIAATQPLAAVVMDVHMPDMSGFDAARKLREIPSASSTPIIFVTADTGDATLQEAYALGAVDLMAKPFRADALRAKVAVFVRLFEREEELRRQSSFLQAVLEGVQDAVVACDGEGRMTVVNRAAKALLGAADPGLRPEEWPAAYRFLEEDSRTPMPPERVPLLRALRGEAVSHQPMVVVSPGGDERHVLAAASPLRTPAGEVLGAMASAHDVTAQREADAARSLASVEHVKRNVAEAAAQRLKESEERFSALLNSSGEGILGLAEDGTCMFANRAATAMLGYEDDQLIGREVHTLVQHSDAGGEPLAPERSRILEALRSGTPVRASDEVFWRKDGQPLHVFYSVHPMMLNRQRTGAVLTFVDLTERRLQEQQLRRSQAELTRLADRLTASDRAKGEFLATLAHELRNPLAPITTGLHLLRLADLGEKAGGTVAMLDRQVKALTRLVDDLLDIARISNDKIELRSDPLDLRQIVHTAVEISGPLIEQQHHSLRVDVPDTRVCVRGDAVRLAQVVSNLLNNAAKYTPAGGKIDVQLEVEGGTATVCVRDSGLGIPATQLQSIFEMFSQVPAHRSYVQGGLGIGLNLVKRLVSLHGGTVSVQSEGEGKGSAFCVHLPVAADAPEDETQEDAGGPSGGQRKLRIIVVDDNVDAGETLATLLEMHGHEVRTASSGQEASALATEFHPDLAFLDIGLPDMSGYELAATLRASPALSATRLVALTGWGAAKDKEQSRRAGFDAHLTKPISIEQLQSVLEETVA